MVKTRRGTVAVESNESAQEKYADEKLLPLDCVNHLLSFVEIEITGLDFALDDISFRPKKQQGTSKKRAATGGDGPAAPKRRATGDIHEMMETSATYATRSDLFQGEFLQRAKRVVESFLMQQLYGRKKQHSTPPTFLFSCIKFMDSIREGSRGHGVARSLALRSILSINGIVSLQLGIMYLGNDFSRALVVLHAQGSLSPTLSRIGICGPGVSVGSDIKNFDLTKDIATALHDWRSLKKLELEGCRANDDFLPELLHGSREWENLNLGYANNDNSTYLAALMSVDSANIRSLSVTSGLYATRRSQLPGCLLGYCHSLRQLVINNPNSQLSFINGEFLKNGSVHENLEEVQVWDAQSELLQLLHAMHSRCFPALKDLRIDCGTKILQLIAQALDVQSQVSGLNSVCLHFKGLDEHVMRALAKHPLKRLWLRPDKITTQIGDILIKSGSLESIAPTLKELYVSRLFRSKDLCVQLAEKLVSKSATPSRIEIGCGATSSTRRRWYEDIIKAYLPLYKQNSVFRLLVVDTLPLR